MHPNLIVHRDPFRMHLNTEVVKLTSGKTIAMVLYESGYLKYVDSKLVRSGAYVVNVNGNPILQKDWNTVLDGEDLIQVIVLPKGGQGSALMKILGAVLIAAAAFFTFGLSLIASVAVGIAAYVGLSLIGNAIPLPANNANFAREARSPTYSLNAQGNEARLMEALPRVYGRVRMYPDLASQPYIEFQGNEQYLYQLFSVSLGDVEIEQILIDENDIDNYSDATYEIVAPGGVVTLFPDNVVTSISVQNLEMLGPNNPSYSILGPFVASPAGTVSNMIAVDIVMPRGAGNINDEGKTLARSASFIIEARLINDSGLPVGGWDTIVSETLTYATTDAKMNTFKVQVPEGRYEVRGRRTNNESDDNRTFDDLQWAGLRAYLPSVFVYPNTTLIAVQMKATNVLNSSTARKFSVIAKSKLQKWNPVDGFTSAEFTNNPAWIAADILRNPIYGRGLPVNRFNIIELYRLAEIFETRGDYFNGVFDSTSQLWEALTKVLRVGRTTPIYYAGVIDFVRDEPKTIPVAMFQPSNMLHGSFEAAYNFFTHDSPDYVVMEYIDETTWKPATVECKLPGEPATKAKTVQLFGCTNRAHAWREGMSLAAANRDRRRTITFTTNGSGFIPYYNSLARVAHDVPQWGYTGRVLSLNPATGQLRTTEPIVFDLAEGGTHVIAFRKRNGSEDGPYTIIPDPTANDANAVFGCIIDADEEDLEQIYISDGTREDRTFYQCGPSERQGMLVLITRAAPTEDGNVAITAINYAESVHTAESGGTVPIPPPSSNLPTTPTAPIVSSVQVLYTVFVGIQNIVATPAPGAIYYEYRAKLDATPNWVSLGVSAESTLQVSLAVGVWTVQVRAVGRSEGPWATWEGMIEATTLPVPSLQTLAAFERLFGIGLEWSYTAISASIASKVEIWSNTENVLGGATKLVELPYPANKYDHTGLSAGVTRYYWGRVIDTAGRVGPWFDSGTSVVGQTIDDATELLDILEGQITETQLSESLLEMISEDGDALVRVEALEAATAAMYTIKTQLTVGGVPYLAGIGVGVENDDGIITSQVLLSASRVAILDESSGTTKVPFVVTGGQVFIDSAIIGNASIGSAKLADWIESDALGPGGVPVLRLNFRTGEIQLNTPTAGSGRMTLNNNVIKVYDSGGIVRVQIGDLLA